MYRVNDKDPSSYHRPIRAAEEAVACPTCERAAGVACVIFGQEERLRHDSDENTEFAALPALPRREDGSAHGRTGGSRVTVSACLLIWILSATIFAILAHKAWPHPDHKPRLKVLDRNGVLQDEIARERRDRGLP